ncbi:YeeE/YedE family protein [Flavobacterium sp.]|uniref:YeeE/YedE family protein n=1 Tax=Flavobacterium sp. TaxID=239 RepID=UPI003527012C
MDFVFDTWHWSISGFLIGCCMLLLIYFGKTFGMSSNLRTVCSIFGAGKKIDFFKFDWREQKWNLAVVVGAMLGGYFATHFLSSGSILELNPKTISLLNELNIDIPNGKLVPDALFSWEAVLTVKGFLVLFLGGMLIGFGTPYAGGCTSGHAITGLSNLQLPSLIAVIGFFIGGLVAVHYIIPLIF